MSERATRSAHRMYIARAKIIVCDCVRYAMDDNARVATYINTQNAKLTAGLTTASVSAPAAAAAASG